MNPQAEQILNEVKKVIVGKDDVIARSLMAILSRGHILLEDVPGVGKTTLALAFSRAMGIDYRRIQFTSDMVPSDIVGFSVYDKETAGLQNKPGAVNQVLQALADAGIGVKYIYSTIQSAKGEAAITMKTTDQKRAETILKNAGVKLCEMEDLK